MSDAAATRAAHAVTHTRLATEIFANTGRDPLKAVAALAGSLPVNVSQALREKQDARNALRDASYDLQFAADCASKSAELSLYDSHTEIKERAAELKANAITKARKALAALEQS